MSASFVKGCLDLVYRSRIAVCGFWCEYAVGQYRLNPVHINELGTYEEMQDKWSIRVVSLRGIHFM
jgi:hypothetical protein